MAVNSENRGCGIKSGKFSGGVDKGGARGRTRTGTVLLPRDFKSLASTYFATRAHEKLKVEARVGIEPALTDLQSAA